MTILICKLYINFLKFWFKCFFKKIKIVGEISNNWPNGLFGTNVYKTWILLIFDKITMNYTASVISKWRIFSPFLSLVILFSVKFFMVYIMCFTFKSTLWFCDNFTV